MQHERLIFLMRVANWWEEEQHQTFVEDFVWARYHDYKVLKLADLSSAIRWEILDGDEISDDEINVNGMGKGIPYICIWEISETLNEDGEPASKEEEKKEPFKPDKTGVPAITDEDLNPEVLGGTDD